MVNYDIPWNPNRLEQRMGRIHRIGQQNEVFIFNLTDTREGAVLAALLRKMEEMRQGLGSDRVFNLIGDLLEDHEISLADLIIDCITNRRRLADAVAGIEQAVSPEHQAALTAAREEGLARRFVNPVLQAAEPGCIDALARGAVFRDVDAKAPERLWFFRGSVGDGTGRVLSQRLFAVRETGLAGDRTGLAGCGTGLAGDETGLAGNGTAGGPPASNPIFVAAHPIRLRDLRPRRDGASVPPLTDFDQRRHAATRFCLEHLVPGFVDAVASGRLKDLGLKERWLERSFRVVISRHADRLLDLDAKADAGQDMALAIGREQRLMEDAKRRQQERLAEVRLEQQLVPRAPEFLGVVTVLPAAARVGEAKADDALLGRVCEAEAAQGRRLVDRLDADARLWLKASEWAQVQHLRSAGLDLRRP